MIYGAAAIGGAIAIDVAMAIGVAVVIGISMAIAIAAAIGVAAAVAWAEARRVDGKTWEDTMEEVWGGDLAKGLVPEVNLTMGTWGRLVTAT
jgi:hypothetical protein